jgi:hypothetical protein
MNLKGCGRKRSQPNLRYYPGLLPGGTEKNQEILRQDSRCPGWDLNSGPPEYEEGVTITLSRRYVFLFTNVNGEEPLLLRLIEVEIVLILQKKIYIFF